MKHQCKLHAWLLAISAVSWTPAVLVQSFRAAFISLPFADASQDLPNWYNLPSFEADAIVPTISKYLNTWSSFATSWWWLLELSHASSHCCIARRKPAAQAESI